jgi:hypothetical protein
MNCTVDDGGMGVFLVIYIGMRVSEHALPVYHKMTTHELSQLERGITD